MIIAPPAGRSTIRLVKADECPPSVCPSRRIECCQTADEFYSTMGCLTQEMLEENLFDSAELLQVRNAGAMSFEHPSLIWKEPETSGRFLRFDAEEFWIFLLFQEVYSMAAFPFPQLAELREKYTYNITPFPTSVKSSGRFVHTEEFLLI